MLSRGAQRPTDIQRLINSVLATVYGATAPRNVISAVTTGGACEFVSWLFSVPGASKSIEDVQIPYSRQALLEYVGDDAAAAAANCLNCSQATATLLAERARLRAITLTLLQRRCLSDLLPNRCNFVGLSCTASLVTALPKRGPHHAHIAAATCHSMLLFDVHLSKEPTVLTVPAESDRNGDAARLRSRERNEEDMLVSHVLLEAMEAATAKEGRGRESQVSPYVESLLRPCSAAEGEDNHVDVVRRRVLPREGVREDSEGVCSTAAGGAKLHRLLAAVAAKSLTHVLFVPREVVTAEAPQAPVPVLSLPQPPSEVQRADGDGMVLDRAFIGEKNVSLPPRSLLVSGSFNPLHAGHAALADAAVGLMRERADVFGSLGAAAEAGSVESEVARVPVVFEITAVNADKPPLSVEECQRRLLQFGPLYRRRASGCTSSNGDNSNSSSSSAPARQGHLLEDAAQFPHLHATGDELNVAVCVTSRARFVDKASLYPRCVFAIGADTLVRLFRPMYYGGCVQEMYAALHTITVTHGCRFIVGGRNTGTLGVAPVGAETGGASVFELMEDTFTHILAELRQATGDPTHTIPKALRAAFVGLPECRFRVDLSSSELRRRQHA